MIYRKDLKVGQEVITCNLEVVEIREMKRDYIIANQKDNYDPQERYCCYELFALIPEVKKLIAKRERIEIKKDIIEDEMDIVDTEIAGILGID